AAGHPDCHARRPRQVAAEFGSMEMQRMRSRPAFPALVGALLAAAIAACSSEGNRDEGVRAPEGGRRQLPPTSPPIANVDNAYVLANATKLPDEKPIDTGDIH